MDDLKELSGRAFEAAEELGHDCIGTEHFLLAMLHPQAQGPASEALKACGVTYESFSQRVAGIPKRNFARPRGDGVTRDGKLVAPEGLTMLGRAEGMAVGLGRRGVRPEHLLLAVIWERSPATANHILDDLGATRELILQQLVRLGVKVPAVPLPPLPRWSDFRPISEEELEELSEDLRNRGVLYRVGYKGGQTLISIAESWR